MVIRVKMKILPAAQHKFPMNFIMNCSVVGQ